jgi:hypothetical protein
LYFLIVDSPSQRRTQSVRKGCRAQLPMVHSRGLACVLASIYRFAFHSSPCLCIHTGVILALVLLLASSSTVIAQSCVPFQGSPETGNKCDVLVSYPNILLQPGQTYREVSSFCLSVSVQCGKFHLKGILPTFKVAEQIKLVVVWVTDFLLTPLR